MRVYEGNLVSKDIKVGIVAARFNEFIVSRLLGGALDGLKRHEVKDDDIDVAWVPGAFEIPLIASKMAKSGKYDMVICLGAVIRGSTSHYDYVCSEVSKGIATVSLQADIPVLFGVLTTDTIEQAIERAGTKAGNKGYDCAVSGIEMVNLIRCAEAKRLIENGMPVSNAATACGYENLSYFSRTFQKVFGKLPSTFSPKKNLNEVTL